MWLPLPEPRRPGWRPATGGAPVGVILSGEHLVSDQWAGASVAGFPIELIIAATDASIEPDLLSGAAAAVVEVSEARVIRIDGKTIGLPID